jgi:translation initiation factor 2 alpha subunit (eIF-2alpha)
MEILRQSEKLKRWSKAQAAIRLMRILIKKDGTSWGMAFALAWYHVLWNYHNWTDADYTWFVDNVTNDELQCNSAIKTVK